eukprot:COSAG06_NODE_1779_length_8414_cov_9.276248_3_plen_208_part_00
MKEGLKEGRLEGRKEGKKAKQSKAKQSKAKQSKAKQSKAKQQGRKEEAWQRESVVGHAPLSASGSAELRRRSAARPAVPRAAAPPCSRRQAQPVRQTPRTSFVSAFPCVCPEPVLAKGCILYINGAKRTAFSYLPRGDNLALVLSKQPFLQPEWKCTREHLRKVSSAQNGATTQFESQRHCIYIYSSEQVPARCRRCAVPRSRRNAC